MFVFFGRCTMKRLIFTAILLSALAANAQQLELVNHLGVTLDFTITIGQPFAPGFPVNFSLDDGQSISTEILKSGKECVSPSGTNPMTYIQTHGHILNSQNAFFATGLICNHENLVAVSGFMSHDMAYSWKNGEHVRVIFCKISDYPCH